MNEVEKGRFCASCHKAVVDLTGKSNEEVLQLIQHSGGGMCGRIEQHRTDVVLPVHRTSFLARFALALLLAFGSVLFSLDARAGNFLNGWKQELGKDSLTDTTVDSVVVQGTVTDGETKEYLPFANVALVHKGNIVMKTQTDFDGNFKFIVPRKVYDKVDIEVMYAGYTKAVTKDIDLSKEKKKKLEVSLQVTMSQQMMGLIIIDIFEPLPGQHDNAPSGKTINMNDYRSMPK